MEVLEQVKGRLDSLRELRTIVGTMKALSAASIRQYERAVTSLADYNRTVELGLRAVLRDMEELPLTPPREGQRPRLAAVVFGSDHGLCGRFNEEMATHVLERLEETEIAGEDRMILSVGVRMSSTLDFSGQSVADQFTLPGSASGITHTVRSILLRLDQWRETESVQYVYLFYNRHSGQRSYQPTGFRLLPVRIEAFHHIRENAWPSRSLPLYTMERTRLLTLLLRQYFFVTLFRACAESQASEHAGRLAAMQSAERNLDERIDEEMTTFRRARQNAITAELLDVVSGFEAIAGEQS